jgi:hypothetical protein
MEEGREDRIYLDWIMSKEMNKKAKHWWLTPEILTT